MEINSFFRRVQLLVKKFFLLGKKEKIFKKGDSIFLKVPNDMPREIVIDLPFILKKDDGIKAAYLAEGFLESDDKPHYIIGLEPKSPHNFDIATTMILLGKDIHKVIPESLYVDFIQLDDRETEINTFMKKYLIPFYVKAEPSGRRYPPAGTAEAEIF